MTAMFTWGATDGRALESARVLLGSGGLRALGRMVRAGQPPRAGDPGRAADGPDRPAGAGEAFTASYRLVVGEDGALSRIAVTSATADRERTLTLNRTEDGYWMLDTGAGGGRREFDGALDVDLAFSPLFNTLPIRRLGLQREPGEHELPVVFVALPELTVQPARQRYRAVAPTDEQGRARVGFAWDEYRAELVVDADGIVLDYPGLAARI